MLKEMLQIHDRTPLIFFLSCVALIRGRSLIGVWFIRVNIYGTIVRHYDRTNLNPGVPSDLEL